MRRAGGAHRGLDMWLVQRASAVYLALFIPLAVFWLLACQPGDHAAWQALFQPVAVKVGVLLFVLALVIHGWIGLREIFIDYVHVLLLRLGLYFLFATLYAACLVWAVDILWSVP
jgi:succinate dehydrogenase / fumarate reductase, membrane anchor subunit